jgi:hypothetical protein
MPLTCCGLRLIQQVPRDLRADFRYGDLMMNSAAIWDGFARVRCLSRRISELRADEFRYGTDEMFMGCKAIVLIPLIEILNFSGRPADAINEVPPQGRSGARAFSCPHIAIGDRALLDTRRRDVWGTHRDLQG